MKEMKNLTDKKRMRMMRNAQIRHEVQLLMEQHKDFTTKQRVYEYVAKKYDLTTQTILLIMQGYYD